MNNPYRARPTRARVDHTAGYGVHNQNVWDPMGRSQPSIPSNNTLQHQPPMINQTKQSTDPWNDSWNWNLDQQSETQQHQQQPQQQQQQQQQHYVPTYSTNQGPLISNTQDHYYQNLNGNNKPDVINQNLTSDRNTPRMGVTRQTSNHLDSFTPSGNYNQNQQYTMPPRPNSVKSGSVGYEHAQWGSEHQPQNVSYVHQRQNQKEPVQRPPSNYNWNKTDQQNVPPQHNWQNHSEALSHWQEPNSGKEAQQHLDNMGNQCVPPLPQQPQPSHMFAPSNEAANKEHSMNWSNGKQGISEMNSWPDQHGTPGNQWQNQNRESAISNQNQPSVQSYNPDSGFASWSKSGNVGGSQEWKQANVQNDLHGNQWLQQQNSNLPEDNVPQDNNPPKSVASDWQQNHTSASQYHLSNVPTTVESTMIASNTEKHDERKSSVPSTSLPNPMIPNDSSFPAKANNSKPQLEHHNAPLLSENTVTSKNTENVSVQENDDFNFKADPEDWKWNDSPEDLSNNMCQLSLGNKLNQQENQNETQETHASVPPEGWSQQSAASFNVMNVRSNTTPDNIPLLPPDFTPTSTENSAESQSAVSQEYVYQHSNKAAENVSQSGYDQWYNQNALPSAAENTWYSKDHGRRPSKQWTTEQNERDIYGSRDSINKETLDNDPKPVVSPQKETAPLRDFRQEVNNVEVPNVPQQLRTHQPLQAEQTPDNYEFASNDRNTFLETGELTDSHQEHEPTPPSQDDENDEVPNDIPFLREVPGQSSSIDPRRNDPTGQEQYVQAGQRLSDPRRNDPSGQEQSLQVRNVSERTERRDVPPGQERTIPLLSRGDSDTLERRNDPSGRERSLPPQQSRNDPSGEERYQTQPQLMRDTSETREVPGRGNESEEPPQQADGDLRQIPGGASPNEVIQTADDRTNGRVVTGSQEVPPSLPTIQDQVSESRSKREEAVGASVGESQIVAGPVNRRDSYEDEDDEGSGNSREDSRERRRDNSPDRRRYEYDRKGGYYDRDREYDDDYYYGRRGGDNDRSYNSRDDFDRRDMPYRDDERKHHSRDDLDRHAREEVDRRGRNKDDLDDRDVRRRPDDRRRERDDPRRRERETRDYDQRYPRDRDYLDRDRRRDDRRPRRYDDYEIRDPYRRDYYDDPYGRSSRPSSRSSYNDRDREYYMRMRDPYYPYNGYAAYGDYGTHYSNNYYAYLENLRRTNPAAYSEWYHKYYASQHQQQHMSRGVSNYPEDRASVHSGRSSCDERTTGDKRTLADMSLLEDSAITSARMTPTKYSTSHAYGCFSIGSLVHVHPSYPADGERAKVDIFRVDNLLLHDPVARDLRAYPGPLIKGVTHKKTIIEYCENKIKKAAVNEDMIDRASYILLYELMIMLIQQNGNVVGVDIAALLLRNKDSYPYDTGKQKLPDTGRRESVISQRSAATSGDGSNQDITTIPERAESAKQRKTVEQITDEFRNTLLYGLVQEALEYAMNEGLWGHALFLASKLDKRTHASVMTRFANSLPTHDPLQTLYQLHSGRVPAIVTCVSDPRWDDWRPHLAMIISNTSANPEINRRSITTLGDTLSARGDIHAAHFCYILAQVDFGAYGANGVKLVLIGSNHHKPYSEFLSTEAIMLTEIYEYARNLSEPGFTLVDLQTFKFDLAVKMIDYGLMEKALLYIEQIAVNIAKEPSKYKKSFIDAVYVLGDRIKYHDPVCKDSIEDAGNLSWLNNLAEIVGKCQTGEITEDDAYNSQVTTDTRNAVQSQETHEIKQRQQQQWTIPQPGYSEGLSSMTEVASTEVQSEWQPLSLPANIQDTYDQNSYMRNNEEVNQYQQPQQQDYWNRQNYYQSDFARNDCTSVNWQQKPTHTPYSSEQADIDNTQQPEKWNYEPTQPAISMTPSMGKQYDPLEELDALETPKQSTKSGTDSKKASEKAADKKPSNSGGSWFGGLFSKLAPKPKNQMILPDDNNPTIVWDPVAKKWMNKDEDGESSSTTFAPPPKATDMSFRAPTVEETPVSQPPQASAQQTEESAATNGSKVVTNNMFKLPKGRSMRANYIDVMNPSGSKSSAASSNIPTPVTSPLMPMATSSPMELFVPAPVNDPSAPMDFLTPTPTPAAPSANPSESVSQGGPMMFNPSEMKDRSVKNVPHNRYPPR